MSLLRAYTPKFLYQQTLSFLNVMFHCPPSVPNNASKSYFQAVLFVHDIIRNDLNDILNTNVSSRKHTTIEQVHSSLVQLEGQLFGSESQFTVDVKGCCQYTQALEKRLSESSSCDVS